jgi:hypothetical protein
VTELVAHLHSKHKTLSSNPCNTHKKKKNSEQKISKPNLAAHKNDYAL